MAEVADFRERYRWRTIPWCTPPDMIKVFWLAFLVGILGVTMVASYALNSEHVPRFIVRLVGGGCLLLGVACSSLVWVENRLCRNLNK